ncbi:Cubilin-like protein [Frankliniella fusca]|uniref:Cubilin-like protein n=1 Tax=Frankliniella fusca TaxID=407009 RepID=A0AAE1HQ46_9NEOP|nr:Cubilin-like protein [Frankliniella fusca]
MQAVITLPLQPGSDGRYDCDLSLSAAAGHYVHVEVDQGSLRALAPCPNATRRHRQPCDCSFLEARDGLSAYAEPMGRLCAARNATAFNSADRHMWLRVAADQPRAGGVVRLIATSRRTTCHLGWKGTETSITFSGNTTGLTLSSPGYPRPPASIRCQYTIDPGSYAMVINVTDLDLAGPEDCQSKDPAARLEDSGRLDITRMTLGTWSGKQQVVVGRQLYAMVSPGLYSLDSVSDTTMSFCGKKRPKAISVPPYSGNVRVTYHSGSSPGRGFMMKVEASRCPPADLREPSGTVFLNNEARNCAFRIFAPDNNTITFFLGDNSYLTQSADCKDGGLEVRDGPSASSPLLGRVCEPSMVRGFYSTGPAMHVKFWVQDSNSYSRIDGYYLTTDQGEVHQQTTFLSEEISGPGNSFSEKIRAGRGCGGSIHQDQGVFSSPMYPAPYRNASVCRWDLYAPGARSPVLAFRAFDLGPITSCDTDFLEIFDVDDDNTETRLARFCGQEKPGFVRGHSHHMAVRYTISVRNGGVGWLAEFRGLATGDQWHVVDTWKTNPNL